MDVESENIDTVNNSFDICAPKCPPKVIPRKKKTYHELRDNLESNDANNGNGQCGNNKFSTPVKYTADLNAESCDNLQAEYTEKNEPSNTQEETGEEKLETCANDDTKDVAESASQESSENLYEVVSDNKSMPNEPELDVCDDLYSSVSDDHIGSDAAGNAVDPPIVPKPVARATTLPANPTFERLIPKPEFNDESTDDSNGLSRVPQNQSFEVPKHPRQPPPRPKITPPQRPKLTPPPPPQTSLNNEPITYVEKTPPQSTKPVERKISSSKKIDMLKKKGLQFKEKSKKVFKSRTSQSEPDDFDDRTKVSQPSISVADNLPTEHSAQLNKSFPGSASKPKRVPPPRPALPSVLKTRRASEPPIHLKGSILDEHSKPALINSVSAIETVPEKNEVLIQQSDTSIDGNLNSLDTGNDFENIIDPTESSDSVFSPEHKPAKPARPPPIQLSDSTMLIKAKKKTDKDEEVSILELLKGKDGDKRKPEIDEKVKDYFAGELYCIAIDDYESSNFTDISFSAGERIFVLRQLDDGVLFGRNENGEEGPFPGKYVCLEDS